MRTLVIGGLAACLVVTGCSGSDDGSGAADVDLPADAMVEYDFQDSSVPPQYHRSYVLKVTQGESQIVVDSYGEVLAEQTVATAPEVWQQLSDGYPELAGMSSSPQSDGCAGGTSFDLTVTQPTETLLDLSAELCGGSNEEVDRIVTTWLAPARQQFPPMDELAPEGE